MTTKTLKVVDFFCGAGGMTQGMKAAGLEVIAGIDIDSDCKATYEANHSESEFILRDIKDPDTNFLAKKYGVKPGDDDLIFIGCSPCQHWTILNTNKDASRDTTGLLIDFWRFVRYYKPGYVVVENVPGIARKSAESGLDKFCQRLKKNGYVVASGVIDAQFHGVPQSRKRFVLIASRIEQSIDLPQRGKESVLYDFIGVHNKFPVLQHGHRDDADFMNTVASLSDKNLERITRTPPDGGTRAAWKDVPELQINAYRGKDNSFKDVYGRLRWDKPASTITTRFNGISNGRFAHPEENRGLSLREGAKLQTFPDNYIFASTSSKTVAKLIGNAVPPELAYKIAQSICAAHNAKSEQQKKSV